MSLNVSRQANKATPPAATPIEFYWRSMFLPFLDTVLQQLIQRFSSCQIDCLKLQYLIPAECVRGNVSFDSIKSAVDFYLPFFG